MNWWDKGSARRNVCSVVDFFRPFLSWKPIEIVPYVIPRCIIECSYQVFEHNAPSLSLSFFFFLYFFFLHYYYYFWLILRPSASFACFLFPRSLVFIFLLSRSLPPIFSCACVAHESALLCFFLWLERGFGLSTWKKKIQWKNIYGFRKSNK